METNWKKPPMNGSKLDMHMPNPMFGPDRLEYISRLLDRANACGLTIKELSAMIKKLKRTKKKLWWKKIIQFLQG